jgi:hypothetical protein
MFQVATLKENKFEDFKNSVWVDKDKATILIDFIETKNLQDLLHDYFGQETNANNGKDNKLELNTIDVLYTRSHTYQLIHGYDGEDNYLASIFNYKRKPIKGKAIIVKIKIDANNEERKLVYNEESITMDDINLIIKDMFFHRGYKITDKIEEFYYDNKNNIENGGELKDYKSVQINVFGVPFRIQYKEGVNNSKVMFLNDIGLFLNKKISEAYISCTIYPQCKCLSLDEKMVRNLIDLVSIVPDEDEIKELARSYSMANNNMKTENVYISFDDFYMQVKKYISSN